MLIRSLVALTIFVASLSAHPSYSNAQDDAKTTNDVTVPADADELTSSNMKLARNTMLRWKQQLDDDPTSVNDVKGFRHWYNHNWILIDRDEAISIDESGKMSSKSNVVLLMRFLIADGRVDDAVAVADRHFSKKTINQFKPSASVFGSSEHRFWADVAQHGVATNERSLIELAGKRIESLAAQEKHPEGRPPAPDSNTIAARFFVAAARLELDRMEFADRNRIGESIDDLWRATGATITGRSSSMHGTAVAYSQLESWHMLDEVPYLAFTHMVDDEQLKQVADMVDRKIYWNRELPDIENDSVIPWLQRQTEQKRFDTAISYLLHAKGKKLVRAKLLASVAAAMAKENPDHARLIRDALENVIETEVSGKADYDAMANQISATAELAIAYQAAEEFELAKTWARRSSELLKHRIGYDLNTSQENHCCTSVLIAAAKTGLVREDLPKALLDWIDKYAVGRPKESLEYFPLYQIGFVATRVDVSNIAERKPPQLEWHKDSGYPRVVEFFQLRNTHQWLPLVEHIEEDSPDNQYHQLQKLGPFSVQQVGFKETLDWTAKLKNRQSQMQLEMRAIQEAVDPSYRIPLQREFGTSGVAPMILWPMKGC